MPGRRFSLSCSHRAPDEATAALTDALEGHLSPRELASVRVLALQAVAGVLFDDAASGCSVLEMRMEIDDARRLRVEVSASPCPQPGGRPRAAGTARGLHLLQRMSDRCGMWRGDDVGVWFELRLGDTRHQHEPPRA